MLFDIGQFPLFWSCFLGTDINLVKIFLNLNMSPLCLISSKFAWSIKTLPPADFLNDWSGFCWDCLLKGYELNHS